MFCTSCGNQLKVGLSFCNKCGVRVTDERNKSRERDPDQLSESSTNLLIAGMLGLPIAGIGIIIGLVTVLKRELQFDNGVILAIVMMAFALMIAAELGFLFLLFSRTRAVKRSRERDERNSSLEPDRLKDASTAQLGEARSQPVGSVTENTTRTLDPVYRETDSPR